MMDTLNTNKNFEQWYPVFQKVLASGNQPKVIEVPARLSIAARAQLQKALCQAGLGFVRMMTSPVATLVGFSQQLEEDCVVMVMSLDAQQLHVAVAEMLIEDEVISCNMAFFLNVPFDSPENILSARGRIAEQLAEHGIPINGVDELLIYDVEDQTLLKLACFFKGVPGSWTRPPRAAKLGIDIQNQVLSGNNKQFLLIDITDYPIEVVHIDANNNEHYIGNLARGTCIPHTAKFELTCPNKSPATTIRFLSHDGNGEKYTLLEMGLPAFSLDSDEVIFGIAIDIDANSQYLFHLENRLLHWQLNTQL